MNDDNKQKCQYIFFSPGGFLSRLCEAKAKAANNQNINTISKYNKKIFKTIKTNYIQAKVKSLL